MDGHGNNMILHHVNMFIVEDNVLQHLSGPSDQFVLKCKKALIIHQKPFNGNSFLLVFNIIISIHEYENEIKFSNRSMTSIYLSHDILLVQ